MPENFIGKIVGLFTAVIIWAALVPAIHESMLLAIESAPDMKALYYLAFGIYLSLPFDVIIAYILHSLR